MDADSYLNVEKAVIHSWAARGFCERVLNSCICQDCDVKTSKVTLTFHYLSFILICYISVPSFIYNLCWVLLLMNHLKPPSGDGKIYLFKLKPLIGFRTLCLYLRLLIHLPRLYPGSFASFVGNNFLMVNQNLSNLRKHPTFRDTTS